MARILELSHNTQAQGADAFTSDQKTRAEKGNTEVITNAERIRAKSPVFDIGGVRFPLKSAGGGI